MKKLRLMKFEIDGNELFGAPTTETPPQLIQYRSAANRLSEDSSTPVRDVPTALRNRYLRLRRN